MSQVQEAEELKSINKDKPEAQEEESQPEPFNFYLKPENTFTIIAHKWVIFTLISALVYTYHLYWTIFGVDQYCDITRTHVCGEEGKNLYQQFKLSEGMTADQIAALNGFPDAPQDAAEASSKVFDAAIAVVTVFHMIEWLRQTVFLTSALVNVNLMPLYYALSINIPYGFIAMIIGIAVRYSADGKECALEGAQLERGRYLQFQILCIFLYIPMMFLHIIYFKVKGVNWLHETTQEACEDEED